MFDPWCADDQRSLFRINCFSDSPIWFTRFVRCYSRCLIFGFLLIRVGCSINDVSTTFVISFSTFFFGLPNWFPRFLLRSLALHSDFDQFGCLMTAQSTITHHC